MAKSRKSLHPEALLLHLQRLERALEGNLPQDIKTYTAEENVEQLANIFKDPGSSFYQNVSTINCLRKAVWDAEMIFSLSAESLQASLESFGKAFNALFIILTQHCLTASTTTDDVKVQIGFAHYAKQFTDLLQNTDEAKYTFWTSSQLPVQEYYFRELLKHYYLNCWLEKAELRPIIEYLTLNRPSIFRELFGVVHEEENITSIVETFEKVTTIPAVFIREAIDTGYKKHIKEGTVTEESLIAKFKQDLFEITAIDVDVIFQATTENADIAEIGGKLRNFIQEIQKNDAQFLIQKTLNKLECKEPSHALCYLYPETVRNAINKFGFNNRHSLIKTIQKQVKSGWPQLIETLAQIDPKYAEIATQIADALNIKPQMKFR